MYKLTLAILCLIAAVSVAQVSAQQCEVCQLVVGRIETYLKNNATEQEILNLLEKDCQALVKTEWVNTCQSVIKHYGEELIQYIIHSETPELACKQMGLCSTIAKPAGDVECLACEFLTKHIEGYLEQNKTEAEILSVLGNDCKILHEQAWVQTCQGIVKSYGSEIIQMLINKESPATVCAELKLCTKKSVDVNANVECVFCEFAVGKVEEYLEKNATETVIMDMILHDCSALVEKELVAECKKVVGEYGPEIINLLVNEMPPSRVCTTLGLCTATKFKMVNQMMGKH